MTCQIVPAGFPDHQNYCPYTTGIKDGIWHGPDMTKARQLAKESRTSRTAICRQRRGPARSPSTGSRQATTGSTS